MLSQKQLNIQIIIYKQQTPDRTLKEITYDIIILYFKELNIKILMICLVLQGANFTFQIILIILFINFFVRLLDVDSTEGRYHNEHIFYLVFEHMDQDLDQFIRECPSPGMSCSIIRVSD